MLEFQKNKVGIIPISDPEKVGHIYIPDMAKERTDQGVVKYCGPECKYVEPGDYVIFSGWSGSAFKIEDPQTGVVERLIILPEDYITAVMEDDPFIIPSLYLRGKDGSYFETTYEIAMEIIAEAWRAREWSPLKIKGSKLERDEYKAGI